jgi:hypothetical protein
VSCLKDKIKDETYRQSRTFNTEGFGFAEGNESGFKLSSLLSFSIITKRYQDANLDRQTSTTGQAEYSIQMDAYFLKGRTLQFPPTPLICSYVVDGYDITLTVREGPLANQTMRFRFNAKAGGVDPENLDAFLTPALRGQVVETVIAAAEQMPAKQRPHPLVHKVAKDELLDALDGLKTATMSRK